MVGRDASGDTQKFEQGFTCAAIVIGNGRERISRFIRSGLQPAMVEDPRRHEDSARLQKLLGAPGLKAVITTHGCIRKFDGRKGIHPGLADRGCETTFPPHNFQELDFLVPNNRPQL